jgi:hypothetical protein
LLLEPREEFSLSAGTPDLSPTLYAAIVRVRNDLGTFRTLATAISCVYPQGSCHVQQE